MELARQKLQTKYRDVQTGGSGSVRRKKIPQKRTKKNTESDQVTNFLKLPNTIKNTCGEHLSADNLNECNKYLSLFTAEFCKVISKGHRKSNRPGVDHHTKIRESMEEYLKLHDNDTDIGFNDNLSNYCVKNFSEDALGQVIKILTICNEIIINKEYLGYNEHIVPTSDSKLKQLYTDLEMDFSVKMFPTSLRNHYIKKLEQVEISDADKRSSLKGSYFSIIKLLTDGVGDNENSTVNSKLDDDDTTD